MSESDQPGFNLGQLNQTPMANDSRVELNQGSVKGQILVRPNQVESPCLSICFLLFFRFLNTFMNNISFLLFFLKLVFFLFIFKRFNQISRSTVNQTNIHVGMYETCTRLGQICLKWDHGLSDGRARHGLNDNDL